MRAIVVRELGGPEVMRLAQQQPPPAAGPGQVVVQVAAAGVNFIDIYHRSGVYQQPLPYVPGIEGAGVVVSVGDGVPEFTPGDHVAWSEGPGSYAGQVALEARHAVICPPDPAWTTSEDGRVFTRLALLSIPSARPATLQYAHAIERDGHLFIAFSRNKATIEVLRLPLSDLDLLRGK